MGKHYIGEATAAVALKSHITTEPSIYGGENNCYRYSLPRRWNKDKPAIMWLLMNPSVATEFCNDRTVARCERFSESWGYGGIFVGNIFAYRATDQSRLSAVNDPAGPENNRYLLEMAQQAEKIILAYGTPQDSKLRPRGAETVRFLLQSGVSAAKFHALKLTKAARPCHPLYLRGDLKPFPFIPES